MANVLAMRNELPLFCGLALMDVDYKLSYRVVWYIVCKQTDTSMALMRVFKFMANKYKGDKIHVYVSS